MPEYVERYEFERLDKQVNGNGQAGITQKLDEILVLAGAAKLHAAERDKRAKRRTAWVSIVAIFLVVPATWGGSHIVSFFSDLYRITEEWHQIHKSEIHQKSFDDPNPKVYADSNQTQRSGDAPAYVLSDRGTDAR